MKTACKITENSRDRERIVLKKNIKSSATGKSILVAGEEGIPVGSHTKRAFVTREPYSLDRLTLVIQPSHPNNIISSLR